MKLGVVMDPITSIRVKSDSTLALMLAAQKRKWEIFYIEPRGLFVENGVAMAKMSLAKLFFDEKKWFELSPETVQPLSALDCVIMRKDPPFDMEYIYATYILETAEKQGCLVVNKPSSLRDCNEKFFATHFSQFMAPTLVTKDVALIEAFITKHRHVMLKPMDWMAGTAIFHLKESDPNNSMLLETFVDKPKRTVMVQKYIPEITAKGDKRILIIDGEPLETMYTRFPKEPGLPANGARGGSAVAAKLSDRDRQICAIVAPILKEKGLLFSAIDIIGDYLTEINVTSPTGLRALEQLYNVNIADVIIDAISTHLPKT